MRVIRPARSDRAGATEPSPALLGRTPTAGHRASRRVVTLAPKMPGNEDSVLAVLGREIAVQDKHCYARCAVSAEQDSHGLGMTTSRPRVVEDDNVPVSDILWHSQPEVVGIHLTAITSAHRKIGSGQEREPLPFRRQMAGNDAQRVLAMSPVGKRRHSDHGVDTAQRVTVNAPGVVQPEQRCECPHAKQRMIAICRNLRIFVRASVAIGLLPPYRVLQRDNAIGQTRLLPQRLNPKIPSVSLTACSTADTTMTPASCTSSMSIPPRESG